MHYKVHCTQITFSKQNKKQERKTKKRRKNTAAPHGFQSKINKSTTFKKKVPHSTSRNRLSMYTFSFLPDRWTFHILINFFCLFHLISEMNIKFYIHITREINTKLILTSFSLWRLQAFWKCRMKVFEKRKREKLVE